MEDNKEIFSFDRDEIGVRGEIVAKREVTGDNKKRTRPVNVDSFDKPMKPFGRSKPSSQKRKAKELIVDSNMENSDWIKKFRLDIPGLTSIAEIEKLFNIPREGKERIEILKKISENYQWLDAYNPMLKPIIDKEIEEYNGKDNETD